MVDTAADKQVFVNNFHVDLSDDIVKVSSIGMTFPKLHAPSGDHVQEKAFRPGRPTYGTIRFEGATHAEGIKSLKQWIKTAYDGKDARKDITVEVRNQKGVAVRTFNLMRCLPTSFEAIDLSAEGGGATMHWVVEVRVPRIEMA